MVAIYQFSVPHDFDTTAAAIRGAVALFGKKLKERPGGEFIFTVPVTALKTGPNYAVYISDTDGVTTIRIMQTSEISKKYQRIAYDKLLVALARNGLDIPVSTGEPYIVTATQIGGGLEQQFTSKQSMSVGGAIAGGMLFGDLGSAMGAFSGKTTGRSKTVLSNSALFLICYSNGMIEEKEVKKNTRLYTEVLAKLNANPVIRKTPIEQSQKEIDDLDKKNKKTLKSIIPLFVFLAILVVMLIVIIAAGSSGNESGWVSTSYQAFVQEIAI